MNGKNDGPIQNLLKALEDVSPSESLDELKASLKMRGIDAEDAIRKARALIDPRLKEHRLAWMSEAQARLARFEAIRTGKKSWREESPEKVESTFTDLLEGRFGREFHEIAMAFRNKKELTLHDKATLLDSLSLLTDLDKPETEK